MSTFFVRSIIYLLVLNGIFISLMGKNAWVEPVYEYYEQEYTFNNGMKALRLHLMTDEKPGEVTDKFTQRSVDSVLVGKKKTDIYLDNHDYGFYKDRVRFMNESKVKFIFREMERLCFARQENEVLALHLTYETSIGDWLLFVSKAFDINMRRFVYSPDHDVLYFFGDEKKTQN